MAEEKQTSLKPLTIYFYHTRLTRESYYGAQYKMWHE